MGIMVWPMEEFEADDGLASATVRASADEAVEQVFICTPTRSSPSASLAIVSCSSIAVPA